MSDLTFRLTYEQVDSIISQQLEQTLKYFEKDLVRPGANIFYYGDDEKDKAEIQRHIDALKLLCEWFKVAD